jgi:hypothetical protein
MSKRAALALLIFACGCSGAAHERSPFEPPPAASAPEEPAPQALQRPDPNDGATSAAPVAAPMASPANEETSPPADQLIGPANQVPMETIYPDGYAPPP